MYAVQEYMSDENNKSCMLYLKLQIQILKLLDKTNMVLSKSP